MKNAQIFTEEHLVHILNWIKEYKLPNPYRSSSIKLIFNEDEMIFSSKKFAIYWLNQNKAQFMGKEVNRITIL